MKGLVIMFKFLGNDFVDEFLSYHFDESCVKDLIFNINVNVIFCVLKYYDIDDKEMVYRVDFFDFSYAFITEDCYNRLLKFIELKGVGNG